MPGGEGRGLPASAGQGSLFVKVGRRGSAASGPAFCQPADHDHRAPLRQLAGRQRHSVESCAQAETCGLQQRGWLAGPEERGQKGVYHGSELGSFLLIPVSHG